MVPLPPVENPAVAKPGPDGAPNPAPAFWLPKLKGPGLVEGKPPATNPPDAKPAEGAPNPDVFAGDVEPNVLAPVAPNELGLGIAGDPKGAPAVPPPNVAPNAVVAGAEVPKVFPVF